MKPAVPRSPEGVDRAAVLAWMASTGQGYRHAARHFGLVEGTVKSWVKRERAAKPKVGKAFAATPQVARAGQQSAKVVSQGTQSSKPMTTGSAPALTPDEIDERILASGRLAILRRFVKLAQPDSLEGGAQVHLAKAAESIARACPQALAWPKGAKPSTHDDEIARIEAVFGKPAQEFAVIQGGAEAKHG